MQGANTWGYFYKEMFPQIKYAPCMFLFFLCNVSNDTKYCTFFYILIYMYFSMLALKVSHTCKKLFVTYNVLVMFALLNC